MSDQSQPEVSQRDGVTVVSFDETFKEIDESLIESLDLFLTEQAKTATPPLVLIDLPNTDFFSSSFIGVLLAASRHVKARGGKFGISRLTPYCHELIEMTKMGLLWEVCETVDDAIQRLTTE